MHNPESHSAAEAENAVLRLARKLSTRVIKLLSSRLPFLKKIDGQKNLYVFELRANGGPRHLVLRPFPYSKMAGF
jgi:hypothetical protein